MTDLKAVNLDSITQGIRNATRPVKILWQADDTLAFVARGREHRSEFHSDPSDEVMYMIKGDMNLHYRTPEGEEKVAVIREGEIIYCPAGVPHSPRFAPANVNQGTNQFGVLGAQGNQPRIVQFALKLSR